MKVTPQFPRKQLRTDSRKYFKMRIFVLCFPLYFLCKLSRGRRANGANIREFCKRTDLGSLPDFLRDRYGEYAIGDRVEFLQHATLAFLDSTNSLPIMYWSM